jgi:hypothetical protein
VVEEQGRNPAQTSAVTDRFRFKRVSKKGVFQRERERGTEETHKAFMSSTDNRTPTGIDMLYRV